MTASILTTLTINVLLTRSQPCLRPTRASAPARDAGIVTEHPPGRGGCRTGQPWLRPHFSKTLNCVKWDLSGWDWKKLIAKSPPQLTRIPGFADTDAKADAWHQGFTGAGGGDRPCHPPAQDTGRSHEHKGAGESSFVVLLSGKHLANYGNTLQAASLPAPTSLACPVTGRAWRCVVKRTRLSASTQGGRRQRLLPKITACKVGLN